MFYTGWNGQVTRVTGLRDVYSQADVADLQVDNILSSAGAAVTVLWTQRPQPRGGDGGRLRQLFCRQGA